MFHQHTHNKIVSSAFYLNSKRFVSLTFSRHDTLLFRFSGQLFFVCSVCTAENRFSPNERQYEHGWRLWTTVLSCYVLNINKLWQFSWTTQFGADFHQFHWLPSILRILFAFHQQITVLWHFWLSKNPFDCFAKMMNIWSIFWKRLHQVWALTKTVSYHL